MKELWAKVQQNKSKALVVLAIFIFIGFFAWGRSADAAELRLGVGAGYTKNMGARSQEIMLTWDDRHWYAAVTRIGGDTLHNYQFTRVTAGYRVNWRRGKRFSPFMRLGGAYFDDEPWDYISDQWAFDMAFGVRLWDVLELEIDQHNSTAGRSDQNSGMDTIMLGMVFPF